MSASLNDNNCRFCHQFFILNIHELALIPGGFEEATFYLRGRHRIYIKKRKGFIKYALQFGYKIMPSYVFGEELSYWQLDVGFNSIRLWLNKYGIPGTVFIGKYFTFLPDCNMDVTIVVGKEIILPKIENPSPEDIDKYHAIYIKDLSALFERNKAKYAATRGDAKLEIL